MIADLAGKVVIVTGAASGIGLASTRLLLSAGAKVFGCDLASGPNPANLNLARGRGENLRFLQCDLTETSTPKKVVQGCVGAFGGKIHGLLNIAGMMDNNSSVDTLRDRDWDKIVAVNLTAPVKLMREVVPVMVQGGGGSIVNVSSKAGTSGAIAGVAYTATKHGLVGATKNVAWRFRHDHVRCNATCPGGVETNIMKSSHWDRMDMDQEASATIKPVHDLHLNGPSGMTMSTAQQQANVLLFLLSDLSEEISGAVIPVDHGWSTI
ncbi:hypothetical protein A1O3_03125 [Capronia epimyces CBS 606.96]|uniref:3-oxoacyl-[acyl-carrier protein] reductase n=1 Tax=Capronia epimyces CBS 606.96 TaxID=1182542 RepID=W9YB21_9EURO|nr:uncharacterized protein A1O3_03125 [Capronia epimyces CBS 606.96]EXJ90057.1 hypothetical protein A1O3_03125 [Capronia epimyces CBS 606.96]